MVQNLVPAWRKLGLKLKYANELPSKSIRHDAQQPLDTQTDYKLAGGRKKRKLSPEIDAQKRSLAAKGNNATLKGSIGNLALMSRNGLDETAIDSNKFGERSGSGVQRNGQEKGGEQSASAISQKVGKRKYVSFAPGTKNEDAPAEGEILDDRKDQAETNEPVVLHNELQHSLEQAVNNKTSKNKKQRRSKSTLIANQFKGQPSLSSSATNTPLNTEFRKSPLVEYIELFHKDRANWKFNKARQNHVFKYIFDIGKIPALYDEALIAYVDGLQGEAARDQLRERALQIRDQDIKDGLDSEDQDRFESKSKETMTDSSGADAQRLENRKSTDEEREKAAYRAGLRRFKERHKWDLINQEEESLQLSDKWEQRLKRRARSEAMLATLGTEKRPIQLEDTLNTSQRERTGVHFDVERTIEDKVDKNGRVTGTKRKRQRKRRTAMPADDSSSDETSSSGEESDSEKTIRRTKLETERLSNKAKALEAKAAGLASIHPKLKNSDSEGTNEGDSDSDNTISSSSENSPSSDSGATGSSDESSNDSD